MRTLSGLLSGFRFVILPLLSLAALTGCGPGEVGDNQVTLVYSGNLNGELEPCGCAEETNLGGILRRYTAVEKFRKHNPGVLLISTGGLLANNVPRDKLKSEYIIKGMQAMHYDAVGVQWRDLAYGDGFAGDFDFPWVSSNYQYADFAKSVTVQKGKYVFSIFSWLDPGADPFAGKTGETPDIDRSAQSLLQAMEQSHEKGNLVVLLTDASQDGIDGRIPLDNVDILIFPAGDEKYLPPQWSGSTLVLRPGTRGMFIAELDLFMDENGAIADFDESVTKLDSGVRDAPALAGWYEEYNEKVKQAYLGRVREQRKFDDGISDYLGASACRGCHASEYDTWNHSEHAHAYNTLEAVGKGFDPDCIACHTVGFEKGGFTDPVVSPHLLDVQCESCHGPGREHVASAGRTVLASPTAGEKPVCVNCHMGSHSPKFDFDVYWPKIRHGTSRREFNAHSGAGQASFPN